MHIGLYCPAETGHLNTMLPIGEALLARGHRVTFLGVEDAQEKVEALAIDFFPLAQQTFPKGSLDAMFETLGKLKGLAALIYTIKAFRQVSQMVLEDGAIACQSLSLDGMVVDQTTIEGAAIAFFLGIPYITICSALPFNPEPEVPPVYTTWRPAQKGWEKRRNQFLHQFISAPLGKVVQGPTKQFFKQHNLPFPANFDSHLAIICHEPKSLEFPRQILPPHFHFTGPFQTSTSRRKIDFPWEKLDGKPLIYASMGTLQNRLKTVFETIAAACKNLDAQLVISLGGAATPEDLPPLPGNPIVVSYAPQIELLQRVTLMITHAGMNTTLEALAQGVPLVAIPVTNDQPGIAARIKQAGAGEFLAIKSLTAQSLRQTVQKVLTEPHYRQAAQKLQAEIAQSGGIEAVIRIIEQALETKQPVVDLP